VNNVIADITKELQGVYSKLNERYYDGKLPEIVISIQSSHKNKAYGWFWKNEWFKLQVKDVDNPVCETIHEINICPEHFTRSIEETIGTLNHEMVHLYCEINGIKDTSNNNVYHNKRFKQEAEKRGLIIEHAKTIGWSKTSLTAELRDFVGGLDIDKSAFEFCRNKASKARSAADKAPTTTYKCPNCESVVRGNVGIKVICGNCNVEMVSKK